MNFKEKYKEAYNKILNSKKVLVVSHINPDMDAIASTSAVCELLEELNKDYKAFSQYKNKQNSFFLPHEEKIEPNINFDLEEFDLLIVLDCGSVARTGLGEKIMEQKDKVFIIEFDHHPQVDSYADLEIRDPNSASTTQVLYSLFVENNIEINKNMANAILSGIITDTGNFFHSSTSEKTMEISSKMLKLGAQFPKIIYKTWHNKSFYSMRLWGRVLDSLKINKKYNFAVSVVTLKDIEECYPEKRFFDSDIFGEIVSFLTNLENINGVLLLREQENGELKGSLRTSKDKVDLSSLASLLGGGGHKKAAGFKIKGELVKDNNFWKIQ